MIEIYLDEQGLLDKIKNQPGEANNLINALESLPKHLPDFSWILDPDFYGFPYANATIADFVFQDPPSPETRDLLLRIQLKISRGDHVESPVGSGITALQTSTKGGIIGSAALKDNFWWNDKTMAAIENSQEIYKVTRFLFQACELSHDHLPVYSSVIYPNIYFHVHPTPRLLQISSEDFEKKIFLHLSWLNDYAPHAFNNTASDRDIIQSAAAAGVEISPESVNTRKNAKAMKDRKITIGGKSITCEWHTKFKYDVGRIHFNAYPKNFPQDIISITGNRIIIGIATGHLQT